MAVAVAVQHGRMSLESVAGLLEPALGIERSRELVSEAALALHLCGDWVSIDQADSLLQELSKYPEMVGVSARFAMRRLKTMRSEAGDEPPRQPTSWDNEPGSGLHRVRIARSELVDLLARTLGREKSEELIRQAGQHLGLSSSLYETDEALSILERLSHAQGLVGITARFAKARLILRLKNQAEQ